MQEPAECASFALFLKRSRRAAGLTQEALSRERFEVVQAILPRLGKGLYAEQVEQALVLLQRSGEERR